MTTTQMEAFLVLAKEGSYTRASKKLFISQSSLSKIIMSLEDELNCSLFLRTGHGIQLTKPGMLAQEYFQFSLSELDTLKNRLRHYGREKKEFLPIAIGTAFSFASMIPQIVQFNKENPDIIMNISECISNGFFTKLDSYEIDLAVGWPSVNVSSDYLVHPLLKDRWGLLVSHENPLARYDIIDLYQARNETFVIPIEPAESRKFKSFCQKNGFRPGTIHSVDSILSMVQLVKFNFGVSFFCAEMVTEDMTEKVKLVRLRQDFPQDLVIITRNEKLSRACERLIEYLTAVFSDKAQKKGS